MFSDNISDYIDLPEYTHNIGSCDDLRSFVFQKIGETHSKSEWLNGGAIITTGTSFSKVSRNSSVQDFQVKR